MIKLPRLTPLVQLVDPKTGLSTRQGADFWNQFANRIEAAIDGIQVAAGGTIDAGVIALNVDPSLFPTLANGTLTIRAEAPANEIIIDGEAWQSGILGDGLGLSGASPNELTLSNTGVLAIGGEGGSIDLGGHISITGSSLDAGGFIESIPVLNGGTAPVGTILEGSTLNVIGNAVVSSGTDGLTINVGGIVISDGGTLFPDLETLVIGSNVTFSASGTSATSGTISASGGGGGGGGGGLVLITSVTASGSGSEIDLLGCFTATYDDYVIEIVGLDLSSAANVGFQWGVSSGPIWATAASYNWGLFGASVGSSGGFGASGTGSANAVFMAPTPISPPLYCRATLYISSPLTASSYKTVSGQTTWYNSTSSMVSANFVSDYTGDVATAYDSFRILSSVVIQSGTVRVYGIVA